MEALAAHRRQQGSNRNRLGQPFKASDLVDYHPGQRSSGSFRRLAVTDQRADHTIEGRDDVLYENMQLVKQGMLENALASASGAGALMPQFI